MTRGPANVTDCPKCGREVGVQPEFNAIPSNGKRTDGHPWRMSKHGHSATTPPCPESRMPVNPMFVRKASDQPSRRKATKTG